MVGTSSPSRRLEQTQSVADLLQVGPQAGLTSLTTCTEQPGNHDGRQNGDDDDDDQDLD